MTSGLCSCGSVRTKTDLADVISRHYYGEGVGILINPKPLPERKRDIFASNLFDMSVLQKCTHL